MEALKIGGRLAYSVIHQNRFLVQNRHRFGRCFYSKDRFAQSDRFKEFKDEDATEILDVHEERLKITESLLKEKYATQLDELDEVPEERVERLNVEELVRLVETSKAKDLTVLKLPPDLKYVDYLLIVTGRSRRHIQGLGETIRKYAKERLTNINNVPQLEGSDSEWIALDLGHEPPPQITESPLESSITVEQDAMSSQQQTTQFDVIETSLTNTFDNSPSLSLTTPEYQSSQLTMITGFTPLKASTPTSTSGFEIKGRRIVHFASLFKQMQETNDHPGPFDCNLSHMIPTAERRVGLHSFITLQCSMCGMIKAISTDITDKIDVNTAAVAGSMAVGIGHSQLEEMFGALDVPCMGGPKYRKVEEEVGKNLLTLATRHMEEAVAEETRLSIENGDVDKDGHPLIAVVVDGTWAKRSYNTKYNSLSGAAAILGARTKKVLYLGVKNKYCFVCCRSEAKGESPSTHKCFRNWGGSSTSMESEIIAEGFAQSLKSYGVIYHKVIGDGDSSTYDKLQKRRPYGSIGIEKVECSNHLLRCYARNLKKLAENKLAGPSRLRKTLGASVVRLRGAVKAASIHWQKNAEGLLSSRVDKLRADIFHSPCHVFGEHSKCSSYFCVGPKVDEENLVPSFQATGLWGKLMEIVNNLARHAGSLIQRYTSNSVESFNCTIAKLIGGKRVNFCMKGSYQFRCMGAVVHHNNKSSLSFLQRQITNRSPGFFTAKLERSRKRRSELRVALEPKSKRNLFGEAGSSKDQDYGPFASKPDMEPAIFQTERRLFLERLNPTPEFRSMLLANTMNQSSSSLWFEERRKRVTASNFGKVCKRRSTTSCKNLVKSLVYPSSVDNKAMAYGRYHEKVAIALLEEREGVTVRPSGLFIHGSHPHLAASPDGLINDDTIVEVKCPYSERESTPLDLIKSGKFPFLTYKNCGVEINKGHDYYFQIQGQLQIADRQMCWFVLYTKSEPFIHVEQIERDNPFWDVVMEEKLTVFYMNCILPELVDPRVPRSMDIRDPQYILAAQKEAEEKSKRKKTNEAWNICIHIMSHQLRGAYDLESLWGVGAKYDIKLHQQDEKILSLLKKHSYSSFGSDRSASDVSEQLPNTQASI